MRQASDKDPIADKVRHVKNATQSRDHECHWPDCTEQVPPAYWGCSKHWAMLPWPLRDKLWAVYRAGQEIDGRPSEAYIEVAREIQTWIAHRPTGSGRARVQSDDPKAEAGNFDRHPPRPQAGKPPARPPSPPAQSTEIQSALHSLALHFADRPAAVIPLFEEVKAEFSERAAIREHLAGLDRWAAEQHAYTDTVEVMNDRYVKKHTQTTLPVG